MDERIQKRIEELTAARDAMVAQANQQIAAFNGAIGELTALLAPEEKAEGAEPDAEGATLEQGDNSIYPAVVLSQERADAPPA